MRTVYAHFPINLVITEGGKALDVRNFLGEKMIRNVPMLQGVTVKTGQKDEIVVEVRRLNP